MDEDWREALARSVEARLTLVLGATDMGKSHFVRSALDQRSSELALLDLDPGQKMVGPPGTVSLGRSGADGALALERFVFIGSTSASALRQLLAAGSLLAHAAGAPLIANTSGFVAGLGARLQALTIATLQPDLVIAIETRGELEPILATIPATNVGRIRRAGPARRKSQAERRQIRQAAFDKALAGAQRLLLPPGLPLIPRPTVPFDDAARPVCALADENGTDLRLAVLDQVSADGIAVFASPPPAPVWQVKLGRMWAVPAAEGWKLLDRLAPP